jgi:predicted S18 family serine protease
MLATLLLLTYSFDLQTVKAEPNLDRRAEMAIDNANTALDRAKKLYTDGEYKASQEAVLEVRDSIELCAETLKATGKDPRKNAKQFKKIEIRIHALVRRVHTFAQSVSIEDRAAVTKVEERIEEINDEIVSGIFTKTK